MNVDIAHRSKTGRGTGGPAEMSRGKRKTSTEQQGQMLTAWTLEQRVCEGACESKPETIRTHSQRNSQKQNRLGTVGIIRTPWEQHKPSKQR